MDIERKQKILALQINALVAERDKKIDTLNEQQRILNAKRQNVYAEYERKIKKFEDQLATLNGRGSGFSRPQKNFEQKA